MATARSDIRRKRTIGSHDCADTRRSQIESPGERVSYREVNRRFVLFILLGIVPLTALALLFEEGSSVLSFFTLTMVPVVIHYFGLGR